MRFLTILSLMIFIVPSSSWAQSPVPSSHPVKEIEAKLKDHQQREKTLESKLKNIKSDLESKRKEMVNIAKDIKNNEQTLTKLEQRIQTKEEEKLNIEDRLKEDRGSISDLILAMERMRRVPPEALIARPGAPLETAQSAMLLESVLPRINKRAEGLKADVDVLETILSDLNKDRASVIKTSKQLEISQKKLTSLLSERESLFSKTSKDVKKEQAELKRISLQASNLRDLVARIEKKQREADKQNEQSFVKKAFHRTPIPRSGQAQLPVSGLITVGYGKHDDIGAVSEGLRVKSRPNALVVAPMGGVIDYTGYFKGYGEIIIIKHQKGYHSLIAGLAKIDTVVGRAVMAGEPIGKMGKLSGNDAPILYYELRYKGNPVNPSKKISGLK